ncbi:MAG TPA: alpha/beta hydrolase [Aestuariivirgaceae bacterium]|nr:alpha/beta hydrolase [Aestuariivirgaceae bacterium]
MQRDRTYAMLEEPGIRRFMAETERLFPADAVSFTMAEQRAFYDQLCAHFRKPRPPGVAVEDRDISGPDGPIPIRIYRPSTEPDLPVALYLHGGGYVVGGLDSHDDICAEIAAQAGLLVVAVAYRLAPEHRFPAAFDDCWAVLTAIAERELGFDTDRIVVGGDSAGGNLAAGLALRARDIGRPRLAGQILIYPGLGGDMSRGSHVEQAHAPGLTTDDVKYYRTVYVGPPDDPGHRSKFAYPLKETSYAGLPPAFLVAAHWDPLRDDCFDYAARLNAAGVAAQVRHEPLLVHAFLRARHMSKAAAASFAAIVEAARSLAWSGRLPAGAQPAEERQA